MARSRNIKPSFFKNEILGVADPLLSLLFASLWTLADRQGRLEDRPLRIKAETFPYREITDFNGYLTQLEQHGFIDRYKVGDLAIIQVVNFRKHQAPHNTEKASELPEKPIDTPLTVKQPLLARKLTKAKRPDSLNTDSLNTDSLIPDLLNPSTLIPEGSAAQKSTSPQKNKFSETDLQLACRSTWKSYSDAYFLKYDVEPVRNAKVNGQIKLFVGRLGFDDAPHVAAFFLQSRASYHIQRGHSVDCLLADAEKLRTEWATGRSSITNTMAKYEDRAQSVSQVVSGALKILESRENEKSKTSLT